MGIDRHNDEQIRSIIFTLIARTMTALNKKFEYDVLSPPRPGSIIDMVWPFTSPLQVMVCDIMFKFNINSVYSIAPSDLLGYRPIITCTTTVNGTNIYLLSINIDTKETLRTPLNVKAIEQIKNDIKRHKRSGDYHNLLDI